MQGLMQDTQLTTNWIFDRGGQFFGRKTVVTNTSHGLQTSTFDDVRSDARRIASALDSLGVSAGGRVATFAWNSARHLSLYFAIPGTGRVMHTANIRYFPDQLIYTVDHAEDEAVFVDRSLLPLFAKYLPELTTVRHVVVMDDGADAELPDDPRIVSWDDVVAAAEPIDFTDRVADEGQGAAICYTTGTTGNPKGVFYTHRSMWLHSNACLSTSTFSLRESDRVLPVVPMFHANAWGLPYASFMAGASFVMPGPDLSPATLIGLMESQQVTVAAGVPTIWMGMVPLLEDHDLSSLRTIICGGSAVPKVLSEAWREAIGKPITQAWGMTETSPLATVWIERSEIAGEPEDAKADLRAGVGIPPPGVELRIVDADSRAELPWDDEATGELECKGPWIARQYYRTDEPGEQFAPDGWLRTG
ncbi:MAG: AMP-binding protein, partial [Jatrophihabitantaceae bacterium]